MISNINIKKHKNKKNKKHKNKKQKYSFSSSYISTSSSDTDDMILSYHIALQQQQQQQQLFAKRQEIFIQQLILYKNKFDKYVKKEDKFIKKDDTLKENILTIIPTESKLSSASTSILTLEPTAIATPIKTDTTSIIGIENQDMNELIDLLNQINIWVPIKEIIMNEVKNREQLKEKIDFRKGINKVKQILDYLNGTTTGTDSIDNIDGFDETNMQFLRTKYINQKKIKDKIINIYYTFKDETINYMEYFTLLYDILHKISEEYCFNFYNIDQINEHKKENFYILLFDPRNEKNNGIKKELILSNKDNNCIILLYSILSGENKWQIENATKKNKFEINYDNVYLWPLRIPDLEFSNALSNAFEKKINLSKAM